jgi:hypothetical protein
MAPEHRERNRMQQYAQRATTWSDLNRAKRNAYQAQGRKRAQKGDPLHEAGCMLYWAEGAKDRNCVVLANSDVHMVRFFKRFAAECFGVADEDFSVRLNVRIAQHIYGAIQEYAGFEQPQWLDGTRVK